MKRLFLAIALLSFGLSGAVSAQEQGSFEKKFAESHWEIFFKCVDQFDHEELRGDPMLQLNTALLCGCYAGVKQTMYVDDAVSSDYFNNSENKLSSCNDTVADWPK